MFLILDLGLNADGLIHDVVEVIHIHLAQNTIHGIQQGGIALDNGDTDVDLAGIDFEVVFAAGEVQDGQVVIGCAGTHGGGFGKLFSFTINSSVLALNFQ